MVPDFIANAGGGVAAAFAMEARTSVFPVEADTVLTAVSKRLRSNTAQVLLASELDHSTHTRQPGFSPKRGCGQPWTPAFALEASEQSSQDDGVGIKERCGVGTGRAIDQ